MRQLLLALAAATALAGAAQAADRTPAAAPRPAVVPPPAIVVVPFTWTGFYAGVVVGAGLDNSTTRYVGGSQVQTWINAGLVPLSQDVAKSGVTAGIEGGYNFQVGPLVTGIEGDFSYLGIGRSSTSTVTTAGPGGVTYTSTSTGSEHWIATVRGRLGIAVDRFLVYGTGGIAFGDYQSSGTLTTTPTTVNAALTNSWQGDTRFNMPGWTIGLGAEAAIIDHVTIKAEALYYSFGRKTYNLDQNLVGTANPVVKTAHADGLLARIGANYKF